MSLTVSSFLFLSFYTAHPAFLLLLFLPSYSQRLCPQNYPDSSLKSSAWNHQITMEKERIQRTRRGENEGTWGENLFFTVSIVSPSPLHQLPSIFYISHCPFTLWRWRDIGILLLTFLSCCLSISVSGPFPPSLSSSLSALSLRLSVNGVIWLSSVIASFSFGRMSLYSQFILRCSHLTLGMRGFHD